MLEAVAQGVALGISLAAPPGPVNAIIASRSLSGWRKGAAVGLGALTADLIFMAITVYVGYIVPSSIFPFISIAGGVFLGWLAYGVFKSREAYRATGGNGASSASYFTGLAMGLTNPFQIMWWMSVGISLARSFGAEIFIGFVAGVLLWVLSFSFSVNKFGVSPRFAKGVRAFSFITLSAFSVYLVAYGFKELFFK